MTTSKHSRGQVSSLYCSPPVMPALLAQMERTYTRQPDPSWPKI
ncbi:hypothetical protein [Prescottella agglutinans]|uniref:Uncharacterized protein n=1 Tax=Prescottella agglutinans TaxID=1644129 RepID=A0ABT6MMZ9_9NOCA|nr:hypothetical protein [Prescottella agglutinans]MDH6285069.1 hypothetical protein [Prescottella agglutinans]